jgi:hypothetical protein
MHIKFVIALLILLAFGGVCSADDNTLKFFPVPARVAPLQLKRPFTLVYNINGEYYGRGKVELQATLSFDGTNLLYRTRNLATGVIHTTLYDGHETYEIDSNSNIAKIEPGFDLDRLEFCPLPGVGLPQAPLLREAIPIVHFSMPFFAKYMAPYLATEKKLMDRTLYNTPGQHRDYGVFWSTDRAAHLKGNINNGPASVVTVPTSDVPRVIWYDTFDNLDGNHLSTVWEFYGQKQFEGVWLASTIKMSNYATLNAAGHNVLFRAATYHLVSSVNGALEPSAYDPTTYLSPHSNIGDETGPIIRSFLYEPGNGPLQAQRLKGFIPGTGMK